MVVEKVVITHGSYGCPEANWYPDLKAKCEERGVRVIVPRYPTPEGQSLENWLSVFKSEVGELSSRTIMIGHSIGATFNMRLLEMSKTPVLASYFVSGSISHLGKPEYRQMMSTFVDPPFKWDRIKENMGVVKIYHAYDDDIVPYEKAEEISAQLGIKVNGISSGGHFIAESGYRSFEVLTDDVLEVIKETN